MNPTRPLRILSEKPDLTQLRRQAKELLALYRSGHPEAQAEVNANYRNADPAVFALHDAQLVLARAYGFPSWPKLKAFVNGATVKRLIAAVQAGNLDEVRGMLQVRPELVNVDLAENDEHRALHFAVFARANEMVRLLMQHGADARKGIYPHRSATTALTIARERGYDEIAAIMIEEEGRRSTGSDSNSTSADDVTRALLNEQDDRALELLAADPALVRATNRGGWTPLHVAAALRNERLVAWLLGHGADPNERGPRDRTPLDQAVGRSRTPASRAAFPHVAKLLRSGGAALTARSAVALGEESWLRARHFQGALVNPIEDWGGLLTIAVEHDRPDMLALLLEFGLDPDERVRLDDLDEAVYSAGMPLWHCAGQGKLEMAGMLLEHGADPNAQVYASGSPVYSAYGQRDWPMVELLKRFGGVVNPITIGLYRQTELARQMLERGEKGSESGSFAGETLAEQLLWAGASGGDPAIVGMALERIDWPRDDVRWYPMLEQPIRLWNHMSGPWAQADLDRGTYVPCFRMILERCDANVLHPRAGRNMLHEVAAIARHVTAEEAVAFATLLLDHGARLDVRDQLLLSTPLGWACRWGRIELVKLFLGRGADRVEKDAEPWATPKSWAEKMGHTEAIGILSGYPGDHAPA